jgi:hypothetical protein
MPTSSYTRRRGSNDGSDIWGEVKCSDTLRAFDLGLVGFGLGLWHSRNPQNLPYTETTGGELWHLLCASERRDPGGKDIGAVHQSLLRLAEVEISVGAPEHELEGVDAVDYEIPCSPVERFDLRLPDGSWATIAGRSDYDTYKREYERQRRRLDREEIARAEECEANVTDRGRGTIRIHWAGWALNAIRARRPVIISPIVWAHLRSLGQRIYAFAQGRSKDEYDDTISFYLGPGAGSLCPCSGVERPGERWPSPGHRGALPGRRELAIARCTGFGGSG